MYKIIRINDILTYIWKFLGLNHNISMSDFYARFALSFGRKNGLHFFFLCAPNAKWRKCSFILHSFSR